MEKFIFLFISLSIISFLLYLLIPLRKVKYQLQYPIINNTNKNLDYIILSKYESKGAFISNQKVKANIKIISKLGRDFKDLDYVDLWIGKPGNPIYLYPENYDEKGDDLRIGPKIKMRDIEISDDNKTLSGGIDIEYSLPGEYNLHTVHLVYKDGKENSWISPNKILIEPTSVLLQIKSYHLALIALLVTVILSLISQWVF